MNKVLVSLSLCVLFVLSVSLVDGKRSGSRKPSSNSGSRRTQDTRRNTTSGIGGSHGGSNQHFLDSERHDTNNRGHIGFEKYNNPSQANPGGFGQGNYKPSAPPAGGVNPGIGSAFGGANYPAKTQNTHVQSAPYPTNNNPGGFGNVPGGGSHYQQPGGFGTNPAGGHYNQPGGFGSNPVGGGQYNQPGGFGSNPAGGHYNQPGGFGQPAGGFGSNPAGGHYNQPGGFGSNPAGGHYNQPGGIGTNPAGGHYNQPGGLGQPGYGGNTHGSHYPAGNPYGGQPNYPVGGYGGHQPNYPGGYGGQGYHPGGSYGGNPGGFGGGYNPGGYGGHPQGGMYSGGGYKTNSGPGFGTGLLGGAAGALPLGLLLGYGLGSMTSSHSSSPGSPASPVPNSNNDAYNTWLKQRTEEKKQEIVATTGDTKAINQTEIVNQILKETQMCPGGTGVLDASILNTMVPCNVTHVDFTAVNVTEPVEEDCKSLSLSIVQVNTATNENKTVTVQIKQNNVTGTNEFVVLSYDVEIVACTTPINNPDGKLCATRSFTADKYHALNETMSYLHTVNISITQFNTTLNDNCTASGACGPDSKPPRNLTSSFINLSILPEYPLNILLHQCFVFKSNSCDPASTTPCDAPLITTKQTIQTNTTLTKADFAYINFVLHESADVFRAYTPPPAQPAEQPGSSSSFTDSTTKSSATTI